MTSDRAGKKFRREVQVLCGRPYAAVNRLVDRFDEVVAKEPLLNRAGLGMAWVPRRSRDERLAVMRELREDLCSNLSVSSRKKNRSSWARAGGLL